MCDSDNRYFNCPAKMSDGRFTTDFISPIEKNLYIQQQSGKIPDWEYRTFLQQNGSKILESEWKALNEKCNCWNSECVFNSSTRQNPSDFQREREEYNKVYGQQLADAGKNCEFVKMEDYRMSTHDNKSVVPHNNHKNTGSKIEK